MLNFSCLLKAASQVVRLYVDFQGSENYSIFENMTPEVDFVPVTSRLLWSPHLRSLKLYSMGCTLTELTGQLQHSALKELELVHLHLEMEGNSLACRVTLLKGLRTSLKREEFSC